jgi:hypothetical protein
MRKTFKIEVEYSDTIKTYKETAVWVDGEVKSGFDNSIISENGAWLFENMSFTEGWIYASDNKTADGCLPIYEKNIEGHISLSICE